MSVSGILASHWSNSRSAHFPLAEAGGAASDWSTGEPKGAQSELAPATGELGNWGICLVGPQTPRRKGPAENWSQVPREQEVGRKDFHKFFYIGSPPIIELVAESVRE